MPKAVSTREAKDTVSALIGWVREHHDEVIIEYHGVPPAVIMSYNEYTAMQEL